MGYLVVIAVSVIDWMLSVSMMCDEVRGRPALLQASAEGGGVQRPPQAAFCLIGPLRTGWCPQDNLY